MSALAFSKVWLDVQDSCESRDCLLHAKVLLDNERCNRFVGPFGGEIGNGLRDKVRPVGLSMAAVEPHFIAGAAEEALFTVYDNFASSIKTDSRVARALRIFGVVNLPQSAVTSPTICATAAAEGPRQILLTDHIHHRIQHSLLRQSPILILWSQRTSKLSTWMVLAEDNEPSPA